MSASSSRGARDTDAARADSGASTGGYTLTLLDRSGILTITTERARWRLTAQWVRVSVTP